MAFEFRLPDIGEGIVEGEIITWHVQEGDVLKEDQPIVEIMTDKATIVIPSPKSGEVLKRFGEEGSVIKVGSVMVVIDADDGGAEISPKPPAAVAQEPEPQRAEPPPSPPPTAPAARAAPPSAPAARADEKDRRALATPATRKLARELGVDISRVPPTGSQGRTTKEDVQRFAQGGARAVPILRRAAPAAPPPTAEERIPFRGLRRKIAEKMSLSKSVIPHFTFVDEVDMTELVALREKAKPLALERGVKLTYLAFIAKALVPAFRKYPLLNSTLDVEAQEIILKHYYNLGVAVDTDDGLVVPVVKNVEAKSVLQIAEEIAGLAEKARDRKLALDDVQGGTFTLSSVGNLGGLFATPIINHPEVAILGVNTIQERPVVRGGVVIIRSMTYLGISLDHRVVDGAMGARFIGEVKRALENPELLFLDMV
jgi:pyruvate dehydrogenase E2 component (dihydrolipoamide acetyltransferase)